MISNVSKRFIIQNRPVLKSFARYKAAYDGDGKTTVRVLNQEIGSNMMIDSYATFGFRLNNGITVLGPMAIFPRTALSWQVTTAYEITKESLRLFAMLEPKVDLLVIGIEVKDKKVADKIFIETKKAKLNAEILQTEHACTTYNFLAAECRNVAAAIIPPITVELNEDDMLQSKLHYYNLYKNKSFHEG